MLNFLYHLLAEYIVPGMMLAFSMCLFFLSVPDKEKLKSYVFARRVLGATFLVYGAALICEAVVREPLASDLTNSMIVVAIGITQAFLFTFSLITLLDTSFLTRRTVCRETVGVVASIALAFTLFALCPRGQQWLVFAVFSLCYVLLMARYVVMFGRHYRRYYQRMDNFFSDDERKRLHWVPVAFYSATAVGVMALLFAWLIRPLTQLLFMLTAVAYYSVFAIRFMNYVHIFPVIEVPLADAAAEQADSNDDCPTATDDEHTLMEQIERLMADKALFKQPDLSIASLAALCGKSYRVVSATINHSKGVNFKTYINEWRVAEAIRLIEDGWLKRHTMNALALETGFTSRVNLYRAFKRKTGLSSTDWIESHDALQQ